MTGVLVICDKFVVGDIGHRPCCDRVVASTTGCGFILFHGCSRGKSQ